MGNISELVRQLRGLLQQVTCHQPGRKRIVLPLVQQPINVLTWLSGQIAFPQFYWMDRTGSEEVAACGEVLHFSDIVTANNFIQQAPDSQIRVWGLNAFDQLAVNNTDADKAFLFVPRLELSIQANQAVIALNLYSTTSLADDAKIASAWLDNLQSAKSPSPISASVLSVQHQPGKSQWINMLNQALAQIEQACFDKVVLARRTELEMSQPVQPIELMSASQHVNHHCYHFMLALSPDDGFLGSTPERLFYRHHRQLMTEALAGTVSSSDDDSEAHELANWLLKDAKNQHENILVVDDIRQRLQGVTARLDVAEPQVIRLRKVQHLYRAINATLTHQNDADCLMRLQPTAAVAGLPRQPALKFILQHEPFERQWYAGSAGYLSFDKTELVVSLRSAKINHNHIYLYAGAGIVAGSNPLYEWQEIENKAAGLRCLLQVDK